MRRKRIWIAIHSAMLLSGILMVAEVSLAATPSADFYVGCGSRDASSGRWEHARDDFRRAVDKNPHSLDAFVGLGRSYRHLGESDRAHEAYAQALRIDPHCAAAAGGWQDTISSAGREQWFTDLSLRAARLPDDADVQETFAEEMLQRGRTDDAATAAEVVLHLDPKLSRAEVVLGRVALSLGHDDEARHHLMQAARQDRADDDAWAALGDLSMKRSDFNGAIENYGRAAKVAPEHADYHEKLAAALEFAGRHADARAERGRAVDLDASSVKSRT